MPWLKALHLIFMVTWFAGLFYLPRLFVYHAMSGDAATRETLHLMERKLYRFVTPLMWLTVGFGIGLIGLYGWQWFLTSHWLQVKLLLVAVLMGYHFYCARLIAELHSGRSNHSHVFFRWFNEFPVLLLFAIVFLAVLKPF